MAKLEGSLYCLSKYKHYIFSFLIQVTLAGFFIHPWDGFFITTSAEQFLQGITPYEVAAEAPLYTFNPFVPWVQMWYSYPPLILLLFSSSYAPYFHLIGENPILGRIFIKLTFILGNLLCAYLIYRFIAGRSSKEKASKAEKLVLYNPFLIFISAVWGMFDIWMVNFLLLTLLSLRRDKLGKAGFYFGLSVLIKPIPAIFAPLFLAHIWNRTRSIAKTAVFASWAIAISSAICLPFFISCPEGFMSQVLGMHAERPPQGWIPFINPLYGGQIINQILGTSFPSIGSSAASAVSMALLATFILTIFLYYCLRKEREEKGLLASLFWLMLTFTLFSHIVNPQFFVIPIALAIALSYTYSEYYLIRANDVRRYYSLLVIPSLLASILMYLPVAPLFVPPDIAMGLVGNSLFELYLEVVTSLPIPLAFLDKVTSLPIPLTQYSYYAIPVGISILVRIPVIIMTVVIVYRSFKKIILTISKELTVHLVRMRRAIRRDVSERLLAVFMTSLFVIIPLFAGIVAYQHGDEEEYTPRPTSFDQEDRLAGIFYHYWWYNPSCNPWMKYGNWLEAGSNPKEGYYDSSYAYMKEDIRQMKQAGIDFAILPFLDYFSERYVAFARASEEEGFYFTPMIELRELEKKARYLASAPDELPFEGNYLSLSKETKRKILVMIDSALILKDSPAFLTYEKKPLVFLDDGFHFHPGWSEKEIGYLTQSVLELYQEENGCDKGAALEILSKNWGVNVSELEKMTRYYPKSIDAFHNPRSKIEQDWSKGFKHGLGQFWKEIKNEIEEKYEDIFWVSDYPKEQSPLEREMQAISREVFDVNFIRSPSLAWSHASDDEEALAYWESQIKLLSDYSKKHDAPAIATTSPYYRSRGIRSKASVEIPLRIEGKLSYDLLWKIALQSEPNIVLIADWNDYYKYCCLEPTAEFGELFLERTEYWTPKFKALVH